MMADNKQRLALVTGASQGIGHAIAQALLADNNECILVGRSEQKLNRACAEFAHGENNVACFEADLADIDEIERLVAEINNRWSNLDVLVNCAGIFYQDSWQQSSVDRLNKIYETNIRGPYALTKALLPMLTASAGDIVFVNSSVAHSDGNGVGQYAASKHALTGLADSLRSEVNTLDVRVLTVYPGRTATPMQEEISRTEGRSYDSAGLLQPSDIADIVIACLKLSRTAEVTEVRIRPMKKPAP